MNMLSTAIFLMITTMSARYGELPTKSQQNEVWEYTSHKDERCQDDFVKAGSCVYVHNAFGYTNSGFGLQHTIVDLKRSGAFEATFTHTLGDKNSGTYGGTHGAPWCYDGWWWGLKSDHSILPIQVSKFQSRVDWTIETEDKGSWNAHLQLYTSHTTNPEPGWGDITGDIFICIDRYNWNPEEWGEHALGEYMIAGRNWMVYRSADHNNMCSFYLTNEVSSIHDLELGDIFKWLVAQGWINPDHYVVCNGAALEIRDGSVTLKSVEFTHDTHATGVDEQVKN